MMIAVGVLLPGGGLSAPYSGRMTAATPTVTRQMATIFISRLRSGRPGMQCNASWPAVRMIGPSGLISRTRLRPTGDDRPAGFHQPHAQRDGGEEEDVEDCESAFTGLEEHHATQPVLDEGSFVRFAAFGQQAKVVFPDGEGAN